MGMTKTATPTATCKRCYATLTSAASIARGRGAHCERLARKEAAVADYKPAQVTAALELIEDGAIIPIRSKVFRTVSTDGAELYLTAPQGCSCPAGVKGRRCYHRAAATMLAA